MTNKVTIRTATAGDAPFLSELLAQLGYPATAEEIPQRLSALENFPHALALVALDGPSVVGLITAHMIPSVHAKEPIAMLTTLVVAETHRGKGIGSQLVSGAERWAVENGAGRVSVVSGLQREESHHFYENRDYKRTGLRFTKVIVPGRY